MPPGPEGDDRACWPPFPREPFRRPLIVPIRRADGTCVCFRSLAFGGRTRR
jgi:hypothetical protein